MDQTTQPRDLKTIQSAIIHERERLKGLRQLARFLGQLADAYTGIALYRDYLPFSLPLAKLGDRIDETDEAVDAVSANLQKSQANLHRLLLERSEAIVAYHRHDAFHP